MLYNFCYIYIYIYIYICKDIVEVKNYMLYNFCYIYKDIVKIKNYIKHLGGHYNNPDQYLACNMCKVYKHISFFRFRNGRCKLCIYLNRYRFTHTKDRFKEYPEKFNIKE